MLMANIQAVTTITWLYNMLMPTEFNNNMALQHAHATTVTTITWLYNSACPTTVTTDNMELYNMLMPQQLQQ